jgi:hypothetical protein
MACQPAAGSALSDIAMARITSAPPSNDPTSTQMPGRAPAGSATAPAHASGAELWRRAVGRLDMGCQRPEGLTPSPAQGFVELSSAHDEGKQGRQAVRAYEQPPHARGQGVEPRCVRHHPGPPSAKVAQGVGRASRAWPARQQDEQLDGHLDQRKARLGGQLDAGGTFGHLHQALAGGPPVVPPLSTPV